ncbi:MAG: peptide chain release factor N(5)-glutamine methyltransferase [Clostridia bacterium]|nr:peptide chain release factor N(5)-glutamine methyltransferase [Clostridia bacterium]
MTLSQIAEILGDAGIPDAKFEAGLLVSHFTGTSRAKMLADPDADYTGEALTDAVNRRAGRYPLQYILGEWEFMGLTFTVNENCLIPRPDTECVTEAAIRLCPNGGRVLDLCTGSGCIAASLLHYTKNSSGYAVELCHDTADLARKNLRDLGLDSRCEVITGDASEDLFPEDETFDIIISNPPYIAKEEMETLEPELDFEPRVALTDEGDGLSLYRAIIRIYGKHLGSGGVMILEHGWKQSDDVMQIAAEYGMTGEVIRDFGGNIRGCVLKMQNESPRTCV